MYGDADPEVLLVQPAGKHSLPELEKEADYLQKHAEKRFRLAAFVTEDWNRELSPWEAPAVWDDAPFGSGAGETLRFLLEEFLPALEQDIRADTKLCRILGGYSLAGLFSLWAAYETDAFSGIAAASPSVWFPGWMGHAESGRPKAEAIYLSLGKKEEKTRNPALAPVGDNIRALSELYRQQDIPCELEWNDGNHFRDSGIRTAKGFCWAMSHIR